MLGPDNAPRHPALDDLKEAAHRLERAEMARERALRAWEVSDEPYPLNAAIALEAAERDLRLARTHLQAVARSLEGWKEEDEKEWGAH